MRAGWARRDPRLSRLRPSTDPILTFSPLSNPANLRAVLDWLAGALRDGPVSRVGLIFHSHGDKDLALTPRVSLAAEETSRAEVAKMLKEGRVTYVRRGISRPAFEKSIRHFSDAISVPVAFVLLESCGRPAGAQTFNLGTNVDSFFITSGQHVSDNYDVIDYEKALRLSPASPVEAIREALRREPTVAEYRPVSQWKKALYFLPLLAVLGVYWISKRRRSNQSATLPAPGS